MGSPAQLGQLQYDLWGVTPTGLWDSALLKEQITRTGLRNSVLVAPMPTASTSQILGDNECFEPYTRYFSFVPCLLDSMFADYFSLATFTHPVSSPVNSNPSAPGSSARSSTSVCGTTLCSSHTTVPSKTSPPCQGDLQDRLGDLTKESARPRRGPRCLHLPEFERAPTEPIAGSADEHAFLWVGEGTEDGDVLPPHEASGAGYPIHC